MTVAAFLDKAEKLEAKGAMALFSSDLKILKSEMASAGMSYRSRIDGDKAAGRKPHSCPPEKIAMKSDDLMKDLKAIPPERRTTLPVRDAFVEMMKKKYPC